MGGRLFPRPRDHRDPVFPRGIRAGPILGEHARGKHPAGGRARMMPGNLAALMRYRMDQAEEATEHNRQCASEPTFPFFTFLLGEEVRDSSH